MMKQGGASGILNFAADFFTSSKTPILRVCCVGIMLLTMASGKAWANTVNLDLTGVGTNPVDPVLGDAYVGAYTFTVNGQPAQLDCDDFNDEVWIGETWTANVTPFTVANVTETTAQGSHLMFAGQTQNYEEAAYLEEALFTNTVNNVTTVNGHAYSIGDVQYAIWDIFESGSSNGLSSADLTAISAILSAAVANYGTGNYSNLVIYSPIDGTQVLPSS